MYKISLTKGKYTLVDKIDFQKFNHLKWRLHINGYACRSDYSSGKEKTILLHRLISDTPTGFDTDHINRNKLDNRRKNLRICTRSQNMRNIAKLVTNTSGYKGVTFHKSIKKWSAQIKLNNKTFIIGYSVDKKQAARIYNKFVLKNFSEYAFLNRI